MILMSGRTTRRPPRQEPKPMTAAKSRKEQMSDLKDAILEITDELASKREELRELLDEIETLKEGKKWRVSAYRFLKASK
jgi:predicted  nucleic acid-binding Zn-ribbon protein